MTLYIPLTLPLGHVTSLLRRELLRMEVLSVKVTATSVVVEYKKDLDSINRDVSVV